MHNYRVEKDRTTNPKRWIVRDLAQGTGSIEIDGLVWWKTFKAANRAMKDMVKERVTAEFLKKYKGDERELSSLWAVLQLTMIASDVNYGLVASLSSIIDVSTVAGRIDELRAELFKQAAVKQWKKEDPTGSTTHKHVPECPKGANGNHHMVSNKNLPYGEKLFKCIFCDYTERRDPQ